MRELRLIRSRAFALVVLLLAACGGGGDNAATDTSDFPPTAVLKASPNVPATAVVTLDGSASSATGGRTLTYNWLLYSKPTGSTAAIDDPAAASPLLAVDIPGVYSVVLTVNDGRASTTATATIVASVYTPPAIISDLVEPVSGNVQLALSIFSGATTITWMVDGVTIGTGTTVTWNTTTVADGSHVVVAHLQFPGAYTVDVSRTFQVSQTTVSFNGATVSESAGIFNAITGAQSANGIVRVDATLDGVAIGSLAAPNACLDPTNAACVSTGPNGYAFTGPVGSGAHIVVLTATDGIGNSLGTQLRFTVTDVSN